MLVGLVALSLAPFASAQSLQCAPQVLSAPKLRAEGKTELVGDISINCFGGTPTPAGKPIPLYNIRVTMNVPVTSRTGAGGFAETVLVMDGATGNNLRLAPVDPALAWSSTAAVPAGNGRGIDVIQSAGPTVFQGRQQDVKSIVWMGVPIDAPASGGTRTLRITNLRVDVSGSSPYPVDDKYPPYNPFPGGPVTAYVTLTSTTGVQVVNNNLTVANFVRSMVTRTAYYDTSLGKVVSLANASYNCQGANLSLLQAQPQLNNFAHSFGIVFDPIVPYWFRARGSTNGLSFPALDAQFPPDTSGTKIQVDYKDVPDGVTLMIPTKVNSGFLEVQLVSPANPVAVGNTGLVKVPVSGGKASIIYEVVSIQPWSDYKLILTTYPVYTVTGVSQVAPGHISITGLFADPDPKVGIPRYDNRFSNTFVAESILNCNGPSVDAQIANFTIRGGDNLCYLGKNFHNEANSCADGRGPWFALVADNSVITPAITNTAVAVSVDMGTKVVNGIVPGALVTQSPNVVPGGDDPAPSAGPKEALPPQTPINGFLALNLLDGIPNAASPVYMYASEGSVRVPVRNNFQVVGILPSAPLIVPENFTDVADYRSGAVSPGQIGSLFPESFGQTLSYTAQLDSRGFLPTLLGDTQLLFDDLPVPLLSIGPAQGYAQINFVAPFSLAGKSTVRARLVHRGLSSPEVVLQVRPASIAIVSADGSGGGTCACLNPDGKPNSKDRPAKPGDIIVAVVNYGGPFVNVSGTDGRSTLTGPYPAPKGPVTATIGGIPAIDIPYAANMPGFLEAAQQWNIRIPLNAKAGPNVLQISAGGATSSSFAVVWVGP